MNDTANIDNDRSGGFKGKHIVWIVLGTIMLTAAITYWTVRTYIYAKDFELVVLSQTEQTKVRPQTCCTWL